MKIIALIDRMFLTSANNKKNKLVTSRRREGQFFGWIGVLEGAFWRFILNLKAISSRFLWTLRFWVSSVSQMLKNKNILREENFKVLSSSQKISNIFILNYITCISQVLIIFQNFNWFEQFLEVLLPKRKKENYRKIIIISYVYKQNY